MSVLTSAANITRVTGGTAEVLINTGSTTLVAIIPEATTTGTLTVRSGAAANGTGTTKHVCAAGLLPAGKSFGNNGALFGDGLTVQPSVAGDAFAIIWKPVP